MNSNATAPASIFSPPSKSEVKAEQRIPNTNQGQVDNWGEHKGNFVMMCCFAELQASQWVQAVRHVQAG
eukprot:4551971-Amphidinium_carterae.1